MLGDIYSNVNRMFCVSQHLAQSLKHMIGWYVYTQVLYATSATVIKRIKPFTIRPITMCCDNDHNRTCKYGAHANIAQ